MRRQISTNFSPNGHSTSRSTSLSRNSLDRYISTARPRNYTLLGPTDDASIFYWTNTPSPVNAAYSHTQRASHSSTASPISPVSDASALYSPSPPSNFSSLSPPQYQNASHHRSPSSRSTRPNTPLPPYRSSTTRSQSNRVPRPQTAQTVGTLGTTGTLRSSQRSLVPEGSIAWTEYSAQQILRGRRTPSSSLDDLVLQDENIVIIPMTPSQDPRTKVCVSFPTSHTIRISTLSAFRRRDSESPAEAIGDDLLRLVREVQERVLGVWSSGATISSDASFGFLLRFEPPADASTWTGSSPTNILPYRRTGVWATKSPEGTAALRILVTLFSTLAEHGYSFMAATQSPQQYIFYATPSQDLPSQRFLAMEIRVYPPKRTRVVPKKSYRLSFFGRSAWSAASSSTAETSSSLPHSESASDWANTSRVEIRCVDFPLPLTQALIRAVRNANPISMDHWWEATTIEEKWSTPSIRVLDALVRRGDSGWLNWENEMDALLTLTSYIIEAMDNEGFVFDASISLPEESSRTEAFTPALLSRERSRSRLWGLFKSKSKVEQRQEENCEREVWVFKRVCSDPGRAQSYTTEPSQ